MPFADRSLGRESLQSACFHPFDLSDFKVDPFTVDLRLPRARGNVVPIRLPRPLEMMPTHRREKFMLAGIKHMLREYRAIALLSHAARQKSRSRRQRGE